MHFKLAIITMLKSVKKNTVIISDEILWRKRIKMKEKVQN